MTIKKGNEPWADKIPRFFFVINLAVLLNKRLEGEGKLV
jgi:hypothetical protein